ncbi:MAG: ATP-binding cassette domain-containing protein [Acholeplasmatales bacterium]|nr:ATP-binding cassette domain-containing protein [Acholeplasmatales bacterium]
MISLANISKSYNKNNILNNITISFDNGLYIIQGINGSGKSTLLRIISGLAYKDSGIIKKEAVVSYLPDKYTMPKLITVKNYLYNLILDKNKKEIFNELTSKYQLPNKRIGSLSKGNIQKLGIIQALLCEADCYIFDEPIDGLDIDAKRIFRDDINNLLKNNKIVIMSLHNKAYFNNLSPTIINIRDGLCDEKTKKIQN